MKLTTLLTTVFLTVTMTISAQQRYVGGDISLLPTYEANWQRFIKLLKQAGTVT